MLHNTAARRELPGEDANLVALLVQLHLDIRQQIDRRASLLVATLTSRTLFVSGSARMPHEVTICTEADTA